MTALRPGARLWFLAAGFVVWSAAFVILYSALSIGCRQGWDMAQVFGGLSLQRLQLVGLYLVHLAIGALLIVWLYRLPAVSQLARFLHRIAIYTAFAALASTMFTFAGAIFLAPC